MGFWKKLFKRKERVPEDEDNWEQIVYARDEVNFHEEEQRSRYITNCMEQIEEAIKEMDLISGEYSLVTSYLMDIEEIEALPEEERDEVNRLASRLTALEQEREQYRDRKRLMTDAEYYRIRKQETEIEEGIAKINKEEKYNVLVKQDLKRLDRERHAYQFRREELETMQLNFRGMALIFLVALVICMVMLAILQFVFEMNTYAGYFVAVLAAAIAITVLCVKYIDAGREVMRVENAVNKLIQLQNKVKIRYVNNVNLLDYLYIKYNTESGAKLEQSWKNYQREKEERKQFAEAEAKVEYYGKQLVEKLSNYRVTDPSRWIHQTRALLDKREMVEIRHGLILRRQSLRKQLDYNKTVADTARSEIMDVVKQYPAYAKEILDMVDRCNKI
uniref:hypothetical protein n=1 Tax=Acetatifactor sp. TaxID=1872090 RepID=UPI0040576FC4